jgi:hypothetical protein
LGDLIIDEIVVREIFEIPETQNVQKGAIAVLELLHTIGAAFTDFVGYFIYACAVK